MDPPGQARYINRVQNDPLYLTAAGVVPQDTYGLTAYFADRLEPGGLEAATATVTCAGVNVATTLNIGGVLFTGAAGADLPNQIFLANPADNNATATSLTAAINHANARLLFVALRGAGNYPVAVSPAAVITLTGNTVGQGSAFSLVTNVPAELTLSHPHMARTFESWTAALLSALSTPIIANMDAGLATTAVAIDALINAVPGVSNTSISSPASTTTVEDILSILAGRGYYVPAGAAKLTNAYIWDTTAAGGFGIPYYKQDSQMLGGEIRPFVIGGDSYTKETRPIRHTYISDELIESLDEGEIAVFRAAPGMPPVTLWPRSGIIPQYPWTYQKALLNPVAQVNNAQIIIVFDDDGTILV
jgi:hypothetical protein